MIPVSESRVSRKVEVEICCTDVASIEAAAAHGVDRVELCADIDAGGVTPSAGMIDFAVRSGIPSVNVLIRPRGGDFVYSDAELQVMEADIATARRLGATGVVIGALTREGDLDMDAMRRLCKAAEGMERIVSRAFDLVYSQRMALYDIIKLGCERILTSGGESSAPEGVEQLHRLVSYSVGRTVIMAGGGVRPENVMTLFTDGGIRAFHTTAHRRSEQPMTDAPSGFGFYAGAYSDASTIAEMVALRDRLNTDKQ